MLTYLLFCLQTLEENDRSTRESMDEILCWQQNLQHSKAASATLIADVTKLGKPGLIFIQEPHVFRGQVRNISAKNYDVISSGSKSRTAILCPKVLGCTQVHEISDNDYTCCIINTEIKQIPKIMAVSCYLDITLNHQHIADKLQIIVDYADSIGVPLILGMDSNAHSNLWGSDETNKRGEALEDFILQNNLKLCNVGSIPTFKTVRTKGTIIDLTMCSNKIANLVEDWKVVEEDNLSDHKRIEFKLKIRYNSLVKVRSLERTNWHLFNDIVNGVEILDRQLWRPQDLDKEVDLFNERINYALEKSCPLREIDLFKQKQPDWWNDEISATRHDVRTLYRKARRKNTESDWEAYRAKRSDFNRMLKKSKRDSWRNFSSEVVNTKNMARLIKNLGNNRLPPAGLFKDSNGETCKNLEDSIQTVFDTLLPGNQEVEDSPTNRACSWTYIEESTNFITNEKIVKAISSFGKNKSPGLDGIKPIMLQNFNDKSISTLSTLFKISIGLRHVPKAWREAKVILLPKPNKERYDLPKSYRPIALTSFSFKTLERLVLWEIEETALKHKSISKHQHAYLKNKSCDTALSAVIDKIEQGVLRGQYSLGVFLDIQGAFDFVNPDRVQQAMKRRDVNELLRKWYGHYLRNRTATIKINESMGKRRIPQGVPQGGIISPIAWNLVIDDLLTHLSKEKNVKVVGYADDLSLILNGLDPTALVDQAQKLINAAVKWGSANNLKFNASKTEAIFFTKKLKTPNFKQLHVNGEAVKYSKGCKYLGIYLDSKLNWNTHLQQKITRCKKLLYALKTTVGKNWGVNPQLTRWVFTGMVRPILAYASHVWWNFHPTNNIMMQLNRLSRLACLAIAKVHRSTPTKGLEIIYNLKPLNIFLDEQATNAYLRVCKTTKASWLNPGGRPGHISLLARATEKLKIPHNIEEKIFVRNWAKHYGVNLNFKDTKHDSHENCNTTYVYTDGSNVNGKSGWGFVTRRDSKIRQTDCGYLGEFASVYQAEIEAVLRAATTLEPLRGDKIIFRIDNQAAVRSLSNPEIKTSQVLECVKALNVLGNNNQVSLRWIKAHHGHIGNEQADEAAKAGAALIVQGPEPFFTVPRTALKLTVHNHFNTKWHNEWHRSKEYVHTKLFYPKPSVKMSKYLRNLSRENTSLLVQIITGHCNMLYHSRHYKSSDEENTMCRLCEEDEEKPWHILTDCPVLMQRRTNIFGTPLFLTNNVSWSPGQLRTFFTEQSILQLLDRDL